MALARTPLRKLERGLPARWYRDPGQYEKELEAFWYSRWIAVAREEELSAMGDYFVASIGTQSIVVLRAGNGGLRAFHNTCRHRGSQLCTLERGRLERERIVCPYHAWAYDLDGRLVATPRRMPAPDFDETRFSLFPVAADSWGGFVFVNLAGRKAKPLTGSLGGLPERFANYGFAGLRLGKRLVTEVKANWKLVAENFSECFHCPPVHPELCRIVTAYREAGAWGLDQAVTAGKPEYRPGAQTLTLDGSSRVPPFPGLTAAERATLYVPEMHLPNLFLNVQPDYVNAHMMFPAGPGSVRIVYDWLFEPQALESPAFDLSHYTALWEATNAQDARNCEWQQAGMQSREFSHGSYVPQEFDCHRFAQWVRRGLRLRGS